MSARGQRILILSDFLPPDFGAAGAYALADARRWAQEGRQVTLIGLSASQGGLSNEQGLSVRRLRVSRRPVGISARARWMARVYPRLLMAAMAPLKAVDEVVFGAGLPYFELCLMPLIMRGGRRFVLRLTDFHPECLIAAYGHASPPGLAYLQHAVSAARQRVDRIEVGGDDQRRRLLEQGMTGAQIVVRRDGLPIPGIGPEVRPQPLPASLRGHVVLLYSGNLGRAHDVTTLCEAYR